MSTDVWIEWIEDEETLVSESGERWSYDAFVRVQKLFRQATNDYLSIDLYLKWVEWMEKMMVDSLEAIQDGNAIDAPQVTLEDVRACYESALLRVQHHMSRVGELWSRYRAFEDLMASVSAHDGGNASVLLKRKLFHRELECAHVNLAKMFAEEYIPWETEVGDVEAPLSEIAKAEIQNVFQSTWLEVEARLSYELELAELEENYKEHHTPDYTRLDSVRRYLSFEQKGIESNKHGRIECLYERVIAMYFLVLDLWQDYASVILHSNAHPAKKLENALFVLRRAIRNYPYSHHLWCSLLLTLEQWQAENPEKTADAKREATEIFERSLQGGLTSGAELILVYKQYLDYRVRNVSNWTDQTQVAAIIALLESARTYFDSYLPEHALEMELYWADVARIRMKNTQQAREVHELSVRRDATNFAPWYAFIQFELREGEIDAARSLFKRAFSSHLESPETLWTQWLDFERTYGDLTSYLFASEKIEKIQKEAALKQAAKQADREVALAEADEAIGKRKGAKAGSEKRQGDSRKSREMREPNAKKMQKSKDGTAVEVGAKKEKTEKARSAPHALPHANTKKAMPNYDPVTLHVAGVPADEALSAAQIAALFAEFGEVAEVRFPRNEMGGLKGFVFVQFKETQAAKEVKKAIKTEKRQFALTFHGTSHPLRVTAAVALRPTPTSGKKSKAPAIEGLEEYKHTVFVSNLSTTTTAASLEAFINRIGAPVPTSLRLPLDRKTGLSRCIAYLDFDREEDVQKATEMLKEKLLEGRRIKAAPSAPTKERTRSEPTTVSQPATSLGSLGGKASEEAEKKAAASGVTTTSKLVPRSVAMRGGHQKVRMSIPATNPTASSMDTS